MTDAKLYVADFAELAGLSEHTIGAYHRRRAARFPAPDGVDIDAGHARPWWSMKTARAWLAARPGRGNWATR